MCLFCTIRDPWYMRERLPPDEEEALCNIIWIPFLIIRTENMNWLLFVSGRSQLKHLKSLFLYTKWTLFHGEIIPIPRWTSRGDSAKTCEISHQRLFALNLDRLNLENYRFGCFGQIPGQNCPNSGASQILTSLPRQKRTGSDVRWIDDHDFWLLLLMLWGRLVIGIDSSFTINVQIPYTPRCSLGIKGSKIEKKMWFFLFIQHKCRIRARRMEN